MTDLFVVTGLGTMFTDPFDKMMLDYLFSKWSISDPAKGSAQMDPAASLRFKRGFFDYHKPFEIATTEIQTDIVGDMEVGQKNYSLLTTVDVSIRMKRIKKDAVDPQLDHMKKEVIRIGTCYNTLTPDIPGVNNILYRGDARDFSGPENYLTSNWQWVIHLAFWWLGQVQTI